MKLNKRELKRIRELVANNQYLYDGVDDPYEEYPLSNEKTRDFIKYEGIDKADELLEYIVSDPDYTFFSKGREGKYWEEDAWILKRDGYYVKFFRIWTKDDICVDIHKY